MKPSTLAIAGAFALGVYALSSRADAKSPIPSSGKGAMSPTDKEALKQKVAARAVEIQDQIEVSSDEISQVFEEESLGGGFFSDVIPDPRDMDPEEVLDALVIVFEHQMTALSTEWSVIRGNLWAGPYLAYNEMMEELADRGAYNPSTGSVDLPVMATGDRIQMDNVPAGMSESADIDMYVGANRLIIAIRDTLGFY